MMPDSLMISCAWQESNLRPSPSEGTESLNRIEPNPARKRKDGRQTARCSVVGKVGKPPGVNRLQMDQWRPGAFGDASRLCQRRLVGSRETGARRG